MMLGVYQWNAPEPAMFSHRSPKSRRISLAPPAPELETSASAKAWSNAAATSTPLPKREWPTSEMRLPLIRGSPASSSRSWLAPQAQARSAPQSYCSRGQRARPITPLLHVGGGVGLEQLRAIGDVGEAVLERDLTEVGRPRAVAGRARRR